MARSYVTVRDVRYELVPWESWTFEEAAEFQRVSGLPVGKIMEGIADMDVNAYRGYLLVSMQRANPSLTERDLVGLNFVETMGSMEQIDEPAEEPPDPPIASPSEGGVRDDAASLSPPTPEASGIQAGFGVSA